MKVRKTKKAGMAVVAMICAVAIVAGCGKKNVDYTIDGKKADSGLGPLAEEYGIPNKIDESMSCGSYSIKIQDDTVTIPSGDTMKKATYTVNPTATLTDQKQLAETLLDKDAGIYNTTDTKTEVQAQIEKNQALKMEAEAAQDTERADSYQQEIDALTEELETAPEEPEPWTDNCVNGALFRGTKDGASYDLNIFEDGGLITYDRTNFETYRPYDGDLTVASVSVSLVSDNDDSQSVDSSFPVKEYDEQNACPITQEQAKDLADAFLEQVGLNGMICTDTGATIWSYFAYDDSVYEQCDGYHFFYRRAVNDTEISQIHDGYVENLQDESMDCGMPSDDCDICVDENGVIMARYVNNLKQVGEEETVTLLSYDEMMKKAADSITEYYKTYSTATKSITFNHVELTYYLTLDEENENQLAYVPAWIFSMKEKEGGGLAAEDDEENSYLYPDQMVAINAIDGSYIDIPAVRSRMQNLMATE